MDIDESLTDAFGDAPYRMLIREIKDFAIFHLDLQGHIQSWNTGAERLFGYAASEVIGREFALLFTLDDCRDGVPERELKTAAETGQVEDARWHQCKDGTRFYTNGVTTALRDENGTLRGFAKVGRDDTKRKLAEDSNKRFFTLSVDILCAAGRDGYFKKVNPAFGKTLGYTQEELLTTPYLDLIHPEDVAATVTVVESLNGDVPLSYFENRYRCRDGSYKWLAWTSAPFTKDGLLYATARDITEQKRIVLALAQSNQRVVTILESITDAFFTLNHEWQFTYLNQQAEPLVQRTREELLGKSIWEAFPAIINSVFDEQYRKAVREQITVNFEAFYPPLNTWFEVHAYPSPNGLSIYFNDISARKQAEYDLRVSEVRYRRLFEAAHDGILILNAETGQIADVNPYLCEFLNYPKHEFMGKELWEIGLFKDKDESRIAFRELQEKGYIRYEDMPLETKTGARREVEFISNVYGENGHHVIQCNIRDITERKQVEGEREQLLALTQQAQTTAEGANRLKDEFLATLSHELRTPLTSIVGWAEMLGNPKLDPVAAQRAIETIRRNGRMQVQMIDDLLDVSRIITGKLRLRVQPVDLGTIIIAAVDTARPAAEAKEIRLQLQLDSPAGQVSGDPDRLQQMTWNLISNAIKFTPKGGRVIVRLERVESHVEISVSDTGLGIASAFLPHVFDRFRQADATSTRSYGGLGLGLAIVRQLVELHGGTVRVESAGVGQGTTFTVSLPFAAVRGAANDVERVPAELTTSSEFECPPHLAGIHVLIVDDEADARELLHFILESCGVRVRTANSAAAALEAMIEEAFDVLISDIGMPEEDGYSLIAKVRALDKEQGGRIPAAALTAYAREEDRIRTLRSGFQIHIPKPVSPSELIAVVANLAGRTETIVS
ncbi:MAG: PAS domain S-box protein [Pyrinomonadaceae bacterium MAG19_C2-C3]|nr:PAS domain S-box protein [Pyrinomonadaceae bacterium MAG19_C2-C3]